jgi:succinate dehydrogenase/fumarate reductase flavoprotein subunit
LRAGESEQTGTGRTEPLHRSVPAHEKPGRPPKSNWALPLDRGPYLAYPIVSANVFTFGGLKVDSSARVLNTDGMSIAGLYAAGETVGMYYANHTGATSVLKGLVFAKLAGETVSGAYLPFPERISKQNKVVLLIQQRRQR